MAYHFHAGQYDAEFGARRLGNWERQRWAPSRARPPSPRGPALADMNGRLLPGAVRARSSAWGHSLGTWDLPRRITREIADKLAKEPPDGRFRSWLKPQKLVAGGGSGTGRGAATDRKATQEPSQDVEEAEDRIINPHRENIRSKDKESIDPNLEVIRLKDNDVNGPYIPGLITDIDKRHESCDFLVEKTKEEIDGPQETNENRFWRGVAEEAEQTKLKKSQDTKCKSGDKCEVKESDTSLKLPKVTPSMGYYHARKMHMEDLQHQPLPDSLAYRYLQANELKESEIVVKPYAIGWKGYGASGPTGCTKMRVHRPKTSNEHHSELEKENMNNARPATTGHDARVHRKHRNPMSQMDLAICWDFRPPDARDEPKRPVHIDGTNGSQAPAVFTLVHTPKAEPDPPIVPNHTNPIFTQGCKTDDKGPLHIPCFEKDMSKNRRRDSCEVQNCPQHKFVKEHKGNKMEKNTKSASSSRKSSSFSIKSEGSRKCDGINGCGTPSELNLSQKNGAEFRPEKLKPIKQAWHNTDANNDNISTVHDAYYKDRRNSIGTTGQQRPSIESYDKTSLAQGKLFQSSPNLSQRSVKSKDSTAVNIGNNGNIEKKHNHKSRYCLTCNGARPPTNKPKQKDEYKFAFKAGNPNSVQSSNTDITNGYGSTDSKNFKIPKMRDPYAKRTYSIPTLAPPFSLWRDASNSGYPEHWRLASVYQHAYKPIDQRRKPLIASVFQ